MYSASKMSLSDQQLNEIVRSRLGTDRKVRTSEELKEGYFNTAYFLELNDGLKCVLKIAPLASIQTLSYEKNILRTEIDMMLLARERTEMPVPEIYGYDTSHETIASDYYLMEYLAGTPLHKLRQTLSIKEQAAIDSEVGRVMRQLNDITGTFFGYPGQPQLQYATWTATFAAMLRALLDDGLAIGAVIPRPYAELYAQASQHFGVLSEVDTPHLVHWDLWDGNILVDPVTKRITGMIDFERALWGDPLMESQFGGLDFSGPVNDGYGRPVFDSSSNAERRHLYNLYLFLIMVIEAYYRDYVEADITHWARGRLDTTLAALCL